jgi:hypothetical protein
VNRTFGAFGILVSLLVLATLGVSSSSRSTQVRAISMKATQRQIRRCGGGAFIIVLPERRSPATSCQISAAKIELAGEFPACDHTADPVDCRSHGDAAYDFAVYGDRPGSAPHVLSNVLAASDPVLNADDLVGIFRALAITKQDAHSPLSKRHTWLASDPRPYLLGMRNWALKQFERLPLTWLLARVADRQTPITPSITWADYLNFADSMNSLHSSPQPAKVELAAQGHVQSGHWLLHSAASSLNHLALLLQAAADRLEQPAEFVSTH